MNRYRIIQRDEERGPYTFEQLRSMWSSGQITADTLYLQEGTTDWEPIDELGLDLAIQQVSPPVAQGAQRMAASTHNVTLAGQVTTKSRGSGIVAIGSTMCIVGVILMFTPAAEVGTLLLVVGFFVAVVGRMMS